MFPRARAQALAQARAEAEARARAKAEAEAEADRQAQARATNIVLNEDRVQKLVNLEFLALRPERDSTDLERAKLSFRNTCISHGSVYLNGCSSDCNGYAQAGYRAGEDQTLFVNASIMDPETRQTHARHFPMLVDIELPRATDEDVRRAEASQKYMESIGAAVNPHEAMKTDNDADDDD